uniref:Uncharacterized protein n=1 Tax=Cacopsylla melanoneura TaxID=428564 RepID=A0A8D9ADJ9_9HEMI
MRKAYSTLTSPPTFAMVIFNASASSLVTSALITAGALSTNFLACTKFIPSIKVLISLIRGTFCLSSNLTSFTVNNDCTTFSSSSSTGAAAGAAANAPIAIIGASGRFNCFFNSELKSAHSSNESPEISLANFVILGE